MATYRLSMSTVSRSRGRSAIAAAAYRSGSLLVNEANGDRFDYRPRGGDVAELGIFAPDNAPAWVGDRSKLWNAAERAENRKNSVTAREIVLSLPHELTAAGRLELMRGYCVELVERYGVAVDMSLHHPDAKGDQRNHHAHILMTTRRIDGNGFTEKTRELDDRSQPDKSKPSRGSAEVESLRKSWEDRCNEALERANSNERVNRRSYARQGIERTPEPRLGPHAHALAQSGQPSLKGRWRDAVRRGDRDDIERAATAYHIHQKAKHGERWPYREPAKVREPEGLQFVAGGPRGAFSRSAGTTTPEIAKTPVRPEIDPFKAVAEKLAETEPPKVDLAKATWRAFFRQQELAKAAQEKAHQQQQAQARGAHAVPQGKQRSGLARIFAKAKIREEAEAAELARQRQAAALAELARRQKQEREKLEEWAKAERKRIARELAKAAQQEKKGAEPEREAKRDRGREQDGGRERERERSRQKRRNYD